MSVVYSHEGHAVVLETVCSVEIRGVFGEHREFNFCIKLPVQGQETWTVWITDGEQVRVDRPLRTKDRSIGDLCEELFVLARMMTD